MAVAHLTTEGNADGVAVTAANTGCTQVVNSTGSMEFDTAFAGMGTVSIMVLPAASGANYLQLTVSSASCGMDYLIRLTAAPTVTMPVLWMGVGGTRSVSLNLSTTGQLLVNNAAGTTVYTSTGTIPMDGTWVRLSLFATPGASTGTFRAAAYVGESSTPITNTDSTLKTAQALNAGSFTVLRWGKSSTANNAATFWFDEPCYDVAASGLIPAQPPAYTVGAASVLGAGFDSTAKPAVSVAATSVLGYGVTNAAGVPDTKTGATSVLGAGLDLTGKPAGASGVTSVWGAGFNTTGAPGGKGGATTVLGAGLDLTGKPATAGVADMHFTLAANSSVGSAGTVTASSVWGLGISLPAKPATSAAVSSVLGAGFNSAAAPVGRAVATAVLGVGLNLSAVGVSPTIGWYGGAPVLGLTYGTVPVRGLSLGASTLL